MLVKNELILSSYKSNVISITTYYINNYDFFIKKKEILALLYLYIDI